MNASADGVCFQLQDVCKTYPGRDTPALSIPFLQIPNNARVAILGDSAAGKSTLMHVLSLLDRPDSSVDHQAQIMYQGPHGLQRFGTAGLDEDRLRLEHFGFVFQQGHLLEHLTCRDNVALSLALAGASHRQCSEVAGALLRQFQLADYAGKDARQVSRNLSGGEKQRVSVLRALAHSPRVLFADEPTGHLDRDNKAIVMQQLVKWQEAGTAAQPRTLLLVTHNVDLAFDYCNCFLRLRDGQLACGGLEVKTGTQVAVPIVGTVATLDDLWRLPETASPTRPAAVALPRSETPAPTTSTAPDHPQLRFLLSLAFRDIMRFGQRFLTLATVSVLVLVTVMCVLGVGLLEGKRRLMQSELETPQALRLDVTHLDGDGLITDHMAERMSQGISRSVAEFPDAVLRRWNAVEFLFWKDGVPRERTGYISGRSAEPGDAFLSSLAYVPGRACERFSDINSPEVIVSTDVLQAIGLPPTATRIAVDYQNAPLELTVVGVFEPGTDDANHFIVPDGLFQSIREGALPLDPPIAGISLSPVPVAEDLLKVGRTVVPTTVQLSGEGDTLSIEVAAGRRLPQSRLTRVAQRLLEKLQEQQMLDAAAVQIKLPPLPAQRPYERTFAYASVFVPSTAVLEDVANAVTRAGLHVENPRFVAMVARIRRTIGPLQAMLNWFVATALVIAATTTGINIYQRVRQKTTEIGVLRACGMRQRHLLIVYALQGILLGLLAVLTSIPGSYALGTLVASRIVESADHSEPVSLFAFDVATVGWIFAVLLLVCLSASVFAAWKPARQSPARAVTGHA